MKWPRSRQTITAGFLVTVVVATIYIIHLAGELTVSPTKKKSVLNIKTVTNSAVNPTTKTLTQTSTPFTNSTRILCLILTTHDRIDRWKAVNSTWAKRCDQHLFIIADENMTETNGIVEGNFLKVKSKEHRSGLTEKVKRALQFAYNHCYGCFDWVLKADDDTYVIVENLKQLLQQHSPSNASYMGLHFKLVVKQGYMSGGAGYVISHEALRQLVEHGLNDSRCKHINEEDVYIGNCFQMLNISIQNSRDDMEKDRFHAEPLDKYLHPPHPKWLQGYHWAEPMFGDNCCGGYPISFHHLTAGQIKLYEQLIYKTSVFGRGPNN